MVSRVIQFILGSTLFLAALSCWGQETCAIRGEADSFEKCLTQSCSTAERTRSVVFPDGRMIYVVGHDHASRRQAMSALLDLKNKKASAQEIRRKLKEILAENGIASQNAELDVEFLKRFLFNNDASAASARVRNEIGVEALQNDMQELRLNLRTLRRFFSEQRGLKQEDKRDAEHTLLTVFGPQLYLESTQSAFFKNANLRGFESEVSVNRANEIEERRQYAFQSLQKKYKTQPEVLDKLLEVRGSLIQLAENYDPEEHDQAQMNKFREMTWSVSNESKGEILNWVKMELELLNARRNRDHVVASRMVKGKGNQLIFAGSMHLNSLARFVRDECLKESGRVARAALTPSAKITVRGLPPPELEVSR